MTPPPILATHDLVLRFGGVTAVNKVSFAVGRGETVALIGPNGAGKTSLFNCVSGLYRPQEGRIELDGRDITRLPPHRIAGHGVARTFQNIELFGRSTVLENLLLGRHRHVGAGTFAAALATPAWRRDEARQVERAERVIDLLELQAYRDRRVGSLPYGVRKLVEIGRALALEPRLLLLDEPCAGLVSEEKEELVSRLADLRLELGLAILLVEHDLRVVGRLAERIVVLDAGRKIADGPPAAVQADPAVVAAYLGVEPVTGAA